MNVITDLKLAIDTFYYNILFSLAELHWSLLRGLVLMGHTVETVNRWLMEEAFAPLIQQTNASLNVAVSFAFVIALLILGLTYLLAALVRLEVVNLRSAVQWYIAGALFFTLGPSLYTGMNDFRMSIAQGFYLSTLQGLQNNLGATFSSLDQVQSTDLALGPLCDYLGVYLPGATGPGALDGIDVALAYLRADGPDIMGFPYPIFSPGCPAHLYNPTTGAYISGVPQDWFFAGSYFDVLSSPDYFDTLDDTQRAASLARASSSHARMLIAWPLVIFGVVEQLVYLLLTIAMGITFLSFSMAILFAFFRKTEVIARSIVDQWIELIVQTVVIAMVQSLVVAFFLAGTAAVNLQVVLGDGAAPRVWVVQRRAIYTAEWNYDPNPDIASFVNGMAVRPVIGIPWSEDNAALFDALSEGAVFNLTLNTGAILRYEFASRSEVLRSDTRIFRQLDPGLVLLLIGETDAEGLPTATRTLITASYPPEQELSRLEQLVPSLPLLPVATPTPSPEPQPTGDMDVQLVSVTTQADQLTTRLRIYNGQNEAVTFKQDDIWLALGYAEDPPGPRIPAEGLQPFTLLPGQAVDLSLVWPWVGEPFAALEIGAWRFGIQLLR